MAHRYNWGELDKPFGQYLRRVTSHLHDSYIYASVEQSSNYTAACQLQDASELVEVTKKLPLVVECPILQENVRYKLPIKTRQIFKPKRVDYLEFLGPLLGDKMRGGEDYRYFLLFHNLQATQSWFRLSDAWLSPDLVTYVPTLVEQGEQVTFGDYGYIGSWDDYSAPTFVKLECQTKALLERQNPIRDVGPLLTLHIPGFENVSGNQMLEIIRDHEVPFERFRLHLAKRLLDLGNRFDSGRLASEVKHLELDLNEQLLDLTEKIRELRTVSAVKATGTQVVIWGLFVYVIAQGLANSALSLIGPGGAVAHLTAELGNYLKQKLELKRNPVYFLYVLSKSKPFW